MDETLAEEAPTKLVLDTNIVLDVFVFLHPQAVALRAQLEYRSLHWLVTLPIRDELECVLQYSNLQPWLQKHELTVAQLLTKLDGLMQIVPVPAKASMNCKDPDDQKFIDLAVAHQAQLWSRDHAVRALKKRLLAQGVTLHAWP
jgi:putative PIN family toxin of toxin-antitoxin system